MKVGMRTVVTLIVVTFCTIRFAAGQDQPQSTISPSTDQYTLYTPAYGQDSDYAITLSTSETPNPPNDCYYPVGSPTYYWDFGPLDGQDNGDGTATIYADVAGSYDVTVYCEQQFEDSEGDTDTEDTLPSDPPLTVQQPSTITFVSSKSNGDGSGGSYTFTVKDQNGNPIENQQITLLETATGKSVVTDGAGFALGTFNFNVNNGTAAVGTDNNGNITDTPVGPTAATVSDFAVSVGETVTWTTTISHTYNLKGPDGTTYTINFTQTQTVVQKGNYNSTTNTGSATTISVSP